MTAPKDYSVAFTLWSSKGEQVVGVKAGTDLIDRFAEAAHARAAAVHQGNDFTAFVVWRLVPMGTERIRTEILATGLYGPSYSVADRPWIDLLIIDWYQRQWEIVEVVPSSNPPTIEAHSGTRVVQ